jgi:SAM-dependent methyltransferase
MCTGRYEEALNTYQQLYRLSPGDTECLLRMGDAYRALRDVDPAIETYEKILTIDPRHIEARYRLAEIWRFKKEFGKAIGQYRKILKINPAEEKARSSLRMCKALRRNLRPRPAWMKRLLESPIISSLLRTILASSPMRRIMQFALDHPGTVHDYRWHNALVLGSSRTLFPETPKGMEPENFAAHFAQCTCPFWKWFDTLEMDRPIRRAVDVGCGTGYVTQHLAMRGIHTIGITYNDYEIEECKRRGIEVMKEDMHFLPFESESVDLVLSSHSLEHSISPLFALWEWRRVLRPGGYLLINVPVAIEGDVKNDFPELCKKDSHDGDFCGGGFGVQAEEGAATHYTYGRTPGHHIFVLTYWQLRWLFHTAGFTVMADKLEDVLSGQLHDPLNLTGTPLADPKRARCGYFLLKR